MTDPLVPANVDLRGMPFMPLDTARLMDSDLFALSSGDEFKAALALWCKAWQQVPAGSVPNDPRILAHLTGTGANWRKVHEVAMRGFVLCTDGRWYHPVIAEKAIEAWSHRVAQRAKAAKRWTAPNPELPGIPAGSPAGHPDAPPTADAAGNPGAYAGGDAAAYAPVMQGTVTGTVKGQKNKDERAGKLPAKGTRMTADWLLPDAWRDYACNVHHIDSTKAVRISLKFRDYYLAVPGEKGVRRDWFATWRTWLGREFPDA